MGKTTRNNGNSEKPAKVTKRRPKGEPTSTPVTPEPTALASAPVKTRPGSIRQTVIGMLGAGNSTEEISAVLKEKFPGTQAAAKAGKHIAHYRSLMKKASREVKA